MLCIFHTKLTEQLPILSKIKINFLPLQNEFTLYVQVRAHIC